MDPTVDPTTLPQLPPDVLSHIATKLVSISLPPVDSTAGQDLIHTSCEIRTRIALVCRAFAAGVASVAIDAVLPRSGPAAAAWQAALAGRPVRALLVVGQPSGSKSERELVTGVVKRAAAGGTLQGLFGVTLQEVPTAFLCQHASGLRVLSLRAPQPADEAGQPWQPWQQVPAPAEQLPAAAASLQGLVGLHRMQSLTLAGISPQQLAELRTLPAALQDLTINLQNVPAYHLALPAPLQGRGGWHRLRSLDFGGPSLTTSVPARLLLRAQRVTLRSGRVELQAEGRTDTAAVASLVQAVDGAVAAAGFSSLTITGQVSMRSQHLFRRVEQDDLCKLLEQHYAPWLGVEVQGADQPGGRCIVISARDTAAPSDYFFTLELGPGSRTHLQDGALVSKLRLPACTSASPLLHHPGFLARNTPSLCALECNLSAGLRLGPYKQLTSLSGFWSGAPAALPSTSGLRELTLLGAPASRGPAASWTAPSGDAAAAPFSSSWLAGVGAELARLTVVASPGGCSLFPLGLQSIMRLDDLIIRDTGSYSVLRLDEHAVVTGPAFRVQRLAIEVQGSGATVGVGSPLFAAAAAVNVSFGREGVWHEGAATSCLVIKVPMLQAEPGLAGGMPLADTLLETLLSLPHLTSFKLVVHSCDPHRTRLLKAEGSPGGLSLLELKAGLEASRFVPYFQVECSVEQNPFQPVPGWQAQMAAILTNYRIVLSIARVPGARPAAT